MVMTVMVMDDGDDEEDDRQPVRESSVERNTYPVDEFNLKLSKSQDQRGKHLNLNFLDVNFFKTNICIFYLPISST